MHAELVVPALFAARDLPRLPALELLLARGRVWHEDPVSPEAWLCRKFGMETPGIPAGAITLLADGGEPGADFWLRADPVHLALERGAPALVAGAALAVTPAEAQALTQALNGHFGGRIEFRALHPGRWCARIPEAWPLEAVPPLEARGQGLETHLADVRWRALLTEIQMALHGHPANAAREVPINSVWFWGAGRLPPSARGPWRSVSADEPLATGLARLAGMRQRALPQDARNWLERLPGEGRHLVVLDQLRAADALGGLEARWFAPLLDALRHQRVGMITVHVPDAGAAHETIRGDLRRFWRRARPLTAYA